MYVNNTISTCNFQYTVRKVAGEAAILLPTNVTCLQAGWIQSAPTCKSILFLLLELKFKQK